MLYNVVLVSAVQHCESVIIIYIYDLSIPPNPSSLGCHRVPGWIPCVIQQLPNSYFTHVHLVVCIYVYVCVYVYIYIYIYIYICYFLNLSYFHLPPHQPVSQVHSLHLCLHSFPTNRDHQHCFSRFHIYAYYTIFVFLFLTYFTLYNRRLLHPPH